MKNRSRELMFIVKMLRDRVPWRAGDLVMVKQHPHTSRWLRCVPSKLNARREEAYYTIHKMNCVLHLD